MKIRAIAVILMLILWTLPCSGANTTEIHVCEIPVRTVLEGVARAGGINLIVDDTVQGNMTMHVSGVTTDEALQAIVASQNLFYEKNGSIHTVTAGGRKDNMVKTFHTWHLQNADPKMIQEVVRTIVPTAAVQCHDESNTLVIGGTSQEAAAVQSLVSRLDAPPRQVDVEVEIASIDRSALKKKGIEWDWSAIRGGSNHEGVFSFLGQIQALEEQGKARILAKPHMMAVNGKEARILIGDKIPVQTEHVTNGEKTMSTEYEDAGIKLTYIPRIHDDNTVTASIEAEVSTPVFVPELKAYRIATRQARTEVRMNEGEPLTIGGLISREDIEHFRKVPVLGDIPLLGKLFRNHYKSNKETEVVIILRAFVVS